MSSRIWKTSFAGSRATDHERICLLHTSGQHNRDCPPEGNAALPGIVFTLDRCVPEQALRSASGKGRPTHTLPDPVVPDRRICGKPPVLSTGSMDQIHPGYLPVLPE